MHWPQEHTRRGTGPRDPDRTASRLRAIKHRLQGEVLERCHTPDWRDERGPPHTVLETHTHLLTPGIKAVHAVPKREDIASNYGRSAKPESLYFINGMTSPPATVKNHVDNLLRIVGRPVTAIINDQERSLLDNRSPGVARSIWHAVMGFLSVDKGREFERAAAQELERTMVSHVNRDHPLHIVAHSQGTIILRNALEHVLGRNSPLEQEEKTRLKNLLRVSIYGAAEHYFPKGLSVHEYAHRDDPIVRATLVLSDVRQAFTRLLKWLPFEATALPKMADQTPDRSEALGKEVPMCRAPITYLQGEHGFASYVERITDFFIEKHYYPDKLRGERLAQELALSISRGDLSDRVHGAIITKLVQHGERQFAREFLHRVNRGRIGLYAVPCMDDLKELAK